MLKIIRIDYVRRLTYNDYELPYMIQKMAIDENHATVGPQPVYLDANGQETFTDTGNPMMIHGRRRIGAWGRNGVKLTVRIAL